MTPELSPNVNQNNEEIELLVKNRIRHIARRKYIVNRLLPQLSIFIFIGSLLLALSFAFNFNGFRDSFQNWYEIAIFFFWVIYAPFVPQACYEGYQEIKSLFEEIHELNVEEFNEREGQEVYLFDGSKITHYPKKLFRFLRGDF